MTRKKGKQIEQKKKKVALTLFLICLLVVKVLTLIHKPVSVDLRDPSLPTSTALTSSVLISPRSRRTIVLG